MDSKNRFCICLNLYKRACTFDPPITFHRRKKTVHHAQILFKNGWLCKTMRILVSYILDIRANFFTFKRQSLRIISSRIALFRGLSTETLHIFKRFLSQTEIFWPIFMVQYEVLYYRGCSLPVETTCGVRINIHR